MTTDFQSLPRRKFVHFYLILYHSQSGLSSQFIQLVQLTLSFQQYTVYRLLKSQLDID